MKRLTAHDWETAFAWAVLILWVLLLLPITMKFHNGSWPVGNFLLFVSYPLVLAVYLLVTALMGKGRPWLRIAGVLVILAALSIPFILRAKDIREYDERRVCFSRMYQIGIAMEIYADDWDGFLPPADRWVDVLQPYVKDAEIFRCPTVRTEAQSTYAMNANLSGVNLLEIDDAKRNTLVMIYETENPGRNPSGTGEDIPAEGIHGRGLHIGFADGHVEWVQTGAARTKYQWEP